jgi:hypothetical protein
VLQWIFVIYFDFLRSIVVTPWSEGFHAGGMAACSRWLSAATPPENDCNLLHPSGMPACFIFRYPSFSLAPLPGCILYFVVPVVSLRSTTGYMLGSHSASKTNSNNTLRLSFIALGDALG